MEWLFASQRRIWNNPHYLAVLAWRLFCFSSDNVFSNSCIYTLFIRTVRYNKQSLRHRKSSHTSWTPGVCHSTLLCKLLQTALVWNSRRHKHYTVNPLLSPRGLIYFKPIWGGRGWLNREGGLIWGWGLFNLEETMVSALYKELE